MTEAEICCEIFIHMGQVSSGNEMGWGVEGNEMMNLLPQPLPCPQAADFTGLTGVDFLCIGSLGTSCVFYEKLGGQTR